MCIQSPALAGDLVSLPVIGLNVKRNNQNDTTHTPSNQHGNSQATKSGTKSSERVLGASILAETVMNLVSLDSRMFSFPSEGAIPRLQHWLPTSTKSVQNQTRQRQQRASVCAHLPAWCDREQYHTFWQRPQSASSTKNVGHRSVA